jgi:hypothetical protein
METCPIIPELDVPRNIILRFPPRRVSRPVNALDFHRRVKRFGEGVVKADPGPARRLPDPQVIQDGGELRRRMIASPVRVEDSAGREISMPGSHLDRRCDQRRLVIIIHCPADDLARRAVNDRGEVQPSFPRCG